VSATLKLIGPGEYQIIPMPFNSSLKVSVKHTETILAILGDSRLIAPMYQAIRDSLQKGNFRNTILLTSR
jgi:hypothetical protein